MTSARIWRVHRHGVEFERIEALSGIPRTTLRKNAQIITFYPDRQLARREKREIVNLFPNLFKANALSLNAHYQLHPVGQGRVADHRADVVQLRPSDAWRFGYQVWSERSSGLLVKLQVFDAAGRVLEQSAFTDLRLGEKVDAREIERAMQRTQSYRVEQAGMVKTSAEREGWRLRDRVVGFEQMGCYQRSHTGGASWMQWIFSDGLASVSLFIEPYDPQRHPTEGGVTAMGATHALARRIPDAERPGWWLTAVGEVPPRTLRAFADAVERTR